MEVGRLKVRRKQRVERRRPRRRRRLERERAAAQRRREARREHAEAGRRGYAGCDRDGGEALGGPGERAEQQEQEGRARSGLDELANGVRMAGKATDHLEATSRPRSLQSVIAWRSSEGRFGSMASREGDGLMAVGGARSRTTRLGQVRRRRQSPPGARGAHSFSHSHSHGAIPAGQTKGGWRVVLLSWAAVLERLHGRATAEEPLRARAAPQEQDPGSRSSEARAARHGVVVHDDRKSKGRESGGVEEEITGRWRRVAVLPALSRERRQAQRQFSRPIEKAWGPSVESRETQRRTYFGASGAASCRQRRVSRRGSQRPR